MPVLLILDVDKKCSFLDIALSFLTTPAVTCYGGNPGEDTNSGFSPVDAWLMVSRANNTSFGLSDSLLFERRNAWEKSTAGNGSNHGFTSSDHREEYIIYSVYDDEIKPRPLIFSSIRGNICTPRGSPLWALATEYRF